MDKFNIFMIVTGCIVVLSAMYILIKKNNNSEDEINTAFFPVDKNKQIEYETSKLYEEVLEQADKMKKEIACLRKEINNITEILNNESTEKETLNQDYKQNGRFNNMLNYNKFISKNADIIELLEFEKTYEEIAKELNKSIREVEMVARLVK